MLSHTGRPTIIYSVAVGHIVPRQILQIRRLGRFLVQIQIDYIVQIFTSLKNFDIFSSLFILWHKGKRNTVYFCILCTKQSMHCEDVPHNSIWPLLSTFVFRRPRRVMVLLNFIVTFLWLSFHSKSLILTATIST